MCVVELDHSRISFGFYFCCYRLQKEHLSPIDIRKSAVQHENPVVKYPRVPSWSGGWVIYLLEHACLNAFHPPNEPTGRELLQLTYTAAPENQPSHLLQLELSLGSVADSAVQKGSCFLSALRSSNWSAYWPWVCWREEITWRHLCPESRPVHCHGQPGGKRLHRSVEIPHHY